MKTDVLFNTPRGNSSRIFLLSFCMTLFLSGCADMPSNATVDDRTSKTSERRKSSPTPKPSTSATTSTTTSKTNGKTTDQATARTNQTEPNGKDDTSTNKKKSQAAEAAPPADAAPAVDDDPPGYYRVKEGDTLGKIAGKFNRSVSELADWNALTNPNVIEVKQMLRVAPPENAQVMRIPLESDIEVRQPGRVIPPPNASPPAVRAVPMNKTTPSGSKVVYSDKAMADLERGDPGPARSLDTIKTPTDSQPASSSRFVWPTEGKVISGFDPTRKGIDIAGEAGQPVLAAGNGKVLYAKNMRGYGNLIILDHGDSMVTAYAHNKTILVREGQTVNQSQQIAEMGDSDADTVKLRFQMRHMGKPIDPVTRLPPVESQTPPVR